MFCYVLYNDELYISNYDLQYILYNIKKKSKWQKAPSQENSLIRVFPWEDIYECVKKKIIVRFTVCDPPIRWSPLLCDKCKRNTVNFYYSSPEWTWKERCGISGEMFLCPFGESHVPVGSCRDSRPSEQQQEQGRPCADF